MKSIRECRYKTQQSTFQFLLQPA